MVARLHHSLSQIRYNKLKLQTLGKLTVNRLPEVNFLVPMKAPKSGLVVNDMVLVKDENLPPMMSGLAAASSTAKLVFLIITNIGDTISLRHLSILYVSKLSSFERSLLYSLAPTSLA